VSRRLLHGPDRARRRAAVARTPGVRALERVEARLLADATLLLVLHFVPGVGGEAGAPQGVAPSAVRVTGPAGAVPVVSVSPVAGDPHALAAVVVPPAGAHAAGNYAVELAAVPGMDPVMSSATAQVETAAPAPAAVPSAYPSGAPSAPAAAPAPASAGAPGPAQTAAPVEPATLPPASIDYLAKDYATFRAQMLDRMAVTLPTWTERNPADIGVMLVEVLAYAADYLSYYQDAAATEAYLGTARLRTSLSRHARLLDYHVNHGCSAVAWVQVRVADRGIVLPRGTRFYTRTAQNAACLVPGSAAYAGAMAESPVAFETLESISPDPGLNEIPLYTWGEESYALPAGATSATLRDAWTAGGRVLGALRPGDVLVLQEQRTGGGGAPDPSHRQAVRVTSVERKVDAAGGALFGGSGSVPVVEIGWHDGDALTFPLVVSGSSGGAPYSGGALALGNLVLADHGRTAGPWELPPVPRAAAYRPYVPVPLVSRRPPFHPGAARLESAAQLVVRDAGRALGEVWLHDDQGRRWRSRADLLGSSPFSRDFVVEADEEGASRLRFGDGKLGMAPPPGTRFHLRCRTGLGLQGNVGRDVLAHVETPAGDPELSKRMLAGILQVRNPLPASAGAAPETGQEVRARAPQAYQVQARGVTPDDWVALAQALPQVRRAAAEPGWEGAGPQDRVWVQRQQGFAEDDAFLAGIRAHLEPARPAGRDLRVLPPRYVGIDVGVKVQLEPHALRSAAEQALHDALGPGPDGVFSPTAFTFGESVWLSQVVAAAAAVAGVVWVLPVRFARWSPYGDDAAVAEELPMGAHEVARMRDDPSQPWNGSLTLELQGGIG